MRRLPLLLAAAVALALPATGVARDDCAADRRILNAWTANLGAHDRITTEQMTLLTQIFSLLSANEQIPRDLVDRLRALVRDHERVLRSTERRLVAVKGGTGNGRQFKRLALRYLREVARPLNRCIGAILVADTRAKMAAVIRCVDSTQRAQAELSRALDRSLKRMAATKSPCRTRP